MVQAMAAGDASSRLEPVRSSVQGMADDPESSELDRWRVAARQRPGIPDSSRNNGHELRYPRPRCWPGHNSPRGPAGAKEPRAHGHYRDQSHFEAGAEPNRSARRLWAGPTAGRSNRVTVHDTASVTVL